MVDDVFAEAVRKAVEDRVGWRTMIIPVTKNNGLRLTGITVRRDGRSGSGRACGGDAGELGEIGSAEAGDVGETEDAVRSIEPNFYLDNIPEDMRTVKNVDDIADRIIRVINRSLEEGGADGIVAKLESLLADKEQLLNSLLPRVVNYEWNKEMLEGLPHRRFLDLAITYEIEIEKNSTCRVRNGIAETLDLTEEELYKAAMRNARLRKYSVMPIWDVIERNMMRNGFRPNVVLVPGEAEAEVEAGDLIPMIVITNESMDKGAYGIVDTELLKSISDGFESVDGSETPDLIIIPSSTNEILALPVHIGACHCENLIGEGIKKVGVIIGTKCEGTHHF